MSDLADIFDPSQPVPGENWHESVAKLTDSVRRALTELGVRQSSLFAIELKVEFTTGANKITHGLGVVPNRFVVTDIDQNSILYRTGTWTKETLELTGAGTAGTAYVKFWREA